MGYRVNLMGTRTGVNWCHHTFNPWEGCSRVSAECTNCYAEARNIRFYRGAHWGKTADRRITADSNWKNPPKWYRAAVKAGVRRRVFCASLSDVFEDRDDLIDTRERLFDMVDVTPHLDWLLLTKRPENIGRLAGRWADLSTGRISAPSNVWLGTSVGVRASADRIEALCEHDASVRFLSCEPLLEDLGDITLTGIDWVIAGGESGPNARRMNPGWAQRLRAQCAEQCVPFWFKQNGGTGIDKGGGALVGELIRELPQPAIGYTGYLAPELGEPV